MEEIKPRGLLLVSFNYSYTPTESDTRRYNESDRKNKEGSMPDCIHELFDKDAFQPNEDEIGYILSNHASLYHPKWEHLDKKNIEKAKQLKKQSGTKRGRKPKPVQEKKSGMNHFMSAISFGVVDNASPVPRTIGVKMFRTGGGNIACLKYDDSDDFVKDILNKLFRYIERNKPGLEIAYLAHRRELSNNITTYKNMNGRVINLFKLSGLLKTAEYNKYYWDCLNMIVVIYDQTSLVAKYNVAESIRNKKGKIKYTVYTCRITPIGELYVYGGNDVDATNRYINKFWNLLEKNEETLLQIGYPSKPPKKPKVTKTE